MGIQDLEQQVVTNLREFKLTQLYVCFINDISHEMDSIVDCDNLEHMDFYRGTVDGLSKAVEIFRKHFNDTSIIKVD